MKVMEFANPKPKPTPRKKKSPAKPRQDEMKGMDIGPTPTPAPSPTATPGTMDMGNMPGMQMSPMPSQSPQPSPAPQQQMDMNNMPGMQMPQASPSPATQKHDMHNIPADENMGNMPMNGNQPMGGMKMNMGPLIVMNGDDMGIRVGSSDSNLMSMGAMGSGTSLQPGSTPMYMYHKYFGDWLTMFH